MLVQCNAAVEGKFVLNIKKGRLRGKLHDNVMEVSEAFVPMGCHISRCLASNMIAAHPAAARMMLGKESGRETFKLSHNSVTMSGVRVKRVKGKDVPEDDEKGGRCRMDEKQRDSKSQGMQS